MIFIVMCHAINANALKIAKMYLCFIILALLWLVLWWWVDAQGAINLYTPYAISATKTLAHYSNNNG